MNGAYTVLAVRIRQELPELRRLAERASRALSQATANPRQQDLFLDSVALSLHDFYCGLERVFRRIAQTVDDAIPGGCDLHRELLQQMTVDLPRIRPRVLSDESRETLDE